MNRLRSVGFARALFAPLALLTVPFLNGCATSGAEPMMQPPVTQPPVVRQPGRQPVAQPQAATIRSAEMTIEVVDLKNQRVSPEVAAKTLAGRKPAVRTIIHPRADTRGRSREEGNKRGTEALGINDQGNIVGDFIDRGGVTRGYVLENVDDPKTMHDIQIEGARFTRPYAINNNGVIIGTFRGADRELKGFRLTLEEVRAAAGRPIRVDGDKVIDMGAETQPLGINDMGTVVGGFRAATDRRRVRPFVQRPGGRPEPLTVPAEIAKHQFVSAFDITEEGFILANYGETNGPGFFIRSRTILLAPTGDARSAAAAAAPMQTRLAADFEVGFRATNSALGINEGFEMIGMCGPIGGSCGGNVSFYQTVSNPNPMRTSGASAELTGTRVIMRVTNRPTTALSKINKQGMFVGTTDSPEGALVGVVGSVR